MKHEFHSISNSQQHDVFPTFSLGHFNDRLHVNFGCPKCYWALNGACLNASLSFERQQEGTRTPDAVKIDNDEALSRDGDINNELSRPYQCVCPYLGIQRGWHDGTPSLFRYNFESLVEVIAHKYVFELYCT